MPMERSPRPWWAWWPAAWSRRTVATQSAPPGPA
jgi:hypothetical protein